MEAGEKSCPYCAEVIKAEAIRCKHCQANLESTPARLPDPPKKGMGMFGKVVIGLVAAIALFLTFGAIVGNTPEGKAKARARNAIELCRHEESSYAGGAGARSIITGACEKLEGDFRSQFGHAP
ncbi:hypothetical protein [Pseudomonas sp. GL-RE-29]|uniref:hypothetical protein n=1 Tax=Pseudomonas sp. GL-RE-29 TaxID=2832375 RepID=UPI001CC0A4A8|nr:hypothetical protein [Pseudomonas sp. GL-RE-29]